MLLLFVEKNPPHSPLREHPSQAGRYTSFHSLIDCLANGRNSSGNPNVIDGTGMSLEQLDRELDYGNPVVIYATAKFKTPKAVVEGAPKNLHVMLLTGYNKITKQHLITDPWTYDDGRTSWTLEKNELESIYDAVGRKNVIIR